jgi:putative Ca2+/H+ antiporter (TMEM165/GDT1 family)
MSQSWRRWQDWATVILGIVLFITPFAFVATNSVPAAWTAYAGGVLLVIAGLWSLSTPSLQSSESSEAVIGVLVFIAPFVLGFTGMTSMAWSAWIGGVLAVLLAGSVLLAERKPPLLARRH